MAAIGESKRRELSEEQGLCDSKRSLNKLPDWVLQHILSFLPTKAAVRTSVLSKRWEYLWTSIPNLDFREKGYQGEGYELEDFMERAFYLRDSKADIKKFYFACGAISESVDIQKWISTSVRRNVEEVYVDLYNYGEPLELPHGLFTCASVEKLHLATLCTLRLPSSICFSNLKVLSLELVRFPDDHSTQMLFSCCPVVEEMELLQCIWVNVKTVSICNPKLQFLTIQDERIRNRHWNDSDSCQIMIFGSCLEFFKYSGAFLNDYCLYDSSSIYDVEINMDRAGPRSRIAAYRLYKLLQEISDVEKLVLSDAAIEALNHAPELLAHLPFFCNLSVLELNSMYTYIDRKVLLKLLQNPPWVEALDSVEGITLSPYDEKDEEGMLDPVAPCFLPHLKIIVVRSYFGSKELFMDAVKTLLHRVVALEKLIVCCHSNQWSEEDTEAVQTELLELPRALGVLEMQLV